MEIVAQENGGLRQIREVDAKERDALRNFIRAGSANELSQNLLELIRANGWRLLCDCGTVAGRDRSGPLMGVSLSRKSEKYSLRLLKGQRHAPECRFVKTRAPMQGGFELDCLNAVVYEVFEQELLNGVPICGGVANSYPSSFYYWLKLLEYRFAEKTGDSFSIWGGSEATGLVTGQSDVCGYDDPAYAVFAVRRPKPAACELVMQGRSAHRLMLTGQSSFTVVPRGANIAHLAVAEVGWDEVGECHAPNALVLPVSTKGIIAPVPNVATAYVLAKVWEIGRWFEREHGGRVRLYATVCYEDDFKGLPVVTISNPDNGKSGCVRIVKSIEEGRDSMANVYLVDSGKQFEQVLTFDGANMPKGVKRFCRNLGGFFRWLAA